MDFECRVRCAKISLAAYRYVEVEQNTIQIKNTDAIRDSHECDYTTTTSSRSVLDTLLEDVDLVDIV
jgi:hypothetical protein